jgi:hypothetical protein
VSRATEAPLCECGCGLRVKSQKYGIWSRWRAGHQNRKQGWQERRPERERERQGREQDQQLSLFTEAENASGFSAWEQEKETRPS